MARACRICGRSGIAAFASAALEIALWVLAGKARGVPVSSLLGGARRTALPTYISLPRYNDPGNAASESQRLAASGYGSLKLHQLDLASVASTRSAVGGGVKIMLDTNCAWPEQQAKSMAAALEPLQLAWLEEPVWPPEDYAALAQVRSATRTPISLGENEYSLSGFRHCLDVGATDILQPSAAKLGLSLMQEVAALARPHGVPVIPHSFYFGPALAATAHFVSTLEGDSPIEFPLGDIAVLREPLQTVQGVLQVPQAPGLGVELDDDMLKQHRLAHREFSA
jgi:L-alanine-DL-glutamate epimerase-like enolase superfamily enzyme